MMQIMRCKSGKHELALSVDDCAYCEIENLKRQLAATKVVERALRLIKSETDAALDLSMEEINDIAREALMILDRTL